MLFHRQALWAAALCAVLARSVDAADFNPPTVSACPGTGLERGEFGGNLQVLRQFYSPPQAAEESNHFLDLWDGGKLRAVALAAGLRDNHALFVNAHGKARPASGGRRHVLYPQDGLCGAGADRAVFSVADVARLLGPAGAARIHNILLSACDLEGAFRAAEWRRHFPNATNIMHAPAGQAGYQPLFFQVFFTDSGGIQPLYERACKTPGGRTHYDLGAVPGRGAKKLTPYLAELFLPGADRPFRIQTAGRELLVTPPATMVLAAGSR